MRFKTARKSEAAIPTASMADIAFLLIIFFMVTTVHDVDRTNVNLPLAKIREKAEQGSPVVVMYQDPQQTYGELSFKFSNGTDMSHEVSSLRDIYLEVSNVTYVYPTAQFVVKADGDMAFERIDELLDTLREAGAQRLLLLTQQGSV
jgi:biopolymer transport protein ExbD